MTNVPSVTFKTRVRDESIAGPNPYRWQDMTSDDYFAGKRVVVFSLPGAFTPTCSTYQLPDFEILRAYQLRKNRGFESHPVLHLQIWEIWSSGRPDTKYACYR